MIPNDYRSLKNSNFTIDKKSIILESTKLLKWRIDGTKEEIKNSNR